MWQNEIDRTYSALEDFRRRMDRWLRDFDWSPGETVARTTFPRTNFYDNGAELVLQAEVPGLTDKDVSITLTQDALTVSGERKDDAPEGYSVHRKERGAWKFSRTFTLPTKVDLEKTTATVKNGLLTVNLAKAPEAQPRQIPVRGS